MMKTSKPVLAGSPSTATFIDSTGPSELITTCPLAPLRQPAAFAPADRTKLKEADVVAAATVPTSSAPSRTTPPTPRSTLCRSHDRGFITLLLKRIDSLRG